MKWACWKYRRYNQPRTSETYRRQDDASGYELQFLLFGMLPVFQNLNYKLQIRLSGVSNKVIKSDTKKSFSSRRGTRRQVMRHFSSNGIDQCLYIISRKLNCLCSLSMFTPIVTVLTIFPLSGGCSETLAGFLQRIEWKSSFSSKQHNNRALIIYWWKTEWTFENWVRNVAGLPRPFQKVWASAVTWSKDLTHSTTPISWEALSVYSTASYSRGMICVDCCRFRPESFSGHHAMSRFDQGVPRCYVDP